MKQYLWISNQIKKEKKGRYHMPREKQFDFDFDVETKFGAT